MPKSTYHLRSNLYRPLHFYREREQSSRRRTDAILISTTAEGCNALNSLTTGAANTGVGWFSLFSTTTGIGNTGVGAGALALNQADNNTAVGGGALFLNTTGTENAAVGANALVHTTPAPKQRLRHKCAVC